MSNWETLECAGKLSGVGGKEPRCYSWRCYELALCVWDFRYTMKFACGSASTYLTCQSYLRKHLWNWAGIHLRGIWTPRQQQSNSPVCQASREDHLCRYLLGDLWVLVALEAQGVQLVLGPPKPTKNSSQVCFRGINHTKRHWFTQKERKTGWKKLPRAGLWLLHCLWQRLHFALKTRGLYLCSPISHRAEGSNSKLLVLPQDIYQNLG